MRFLLLTASTSKTAAEPVSFQPRHRPRFNGVLPPYAGFGCTSIGWNETCIDAEQAIMAGS
jgi:hypothetical protein